MKHVIIRLKDESASLIDGDKTIKLSKEVYNVLKKKVTIKTDDYNFRLTILMTSPYRHTCDAAVIPLLTKKLVEGKLIFIERHTLLYSVVNHVILDANSKGN